MFVPFLLLGWDYFESSRQGKTSIDDAKDNLLKIIVTENGI